MHSQVNYGSCIIFGPFITNSSFSSQIVSEEQVQAHTHLASCTRVSEYSQHCPVPTWWAWRRRALTRNLSLAGWPQLQGTPGTPGLGLTQTKYITIWNLAQTGKSSGSVYITHYSLIHISPSEWHMLWLALTDLREIQGNADLYLSWNLVKYTAHLILYGHFSQGGYNEQSM